MTDTQQDSQPPVDCTRVSQPDGNGQNANTEGQAPSKVIVSKDKVPEELRVNYQRRLAEARRANSPEPVGNARPWHTRIATSELLIAAMELRAKNLPSTVRILSGGIPEGFYNTEMVDELRACLAKEIKVKIVVCNDSEDAIADSVKELARESQGLRDDNGDPMFVLKLKNPEVTKPYRQGHFLLVGDNAFRLEDEHPDLTGETFTDYEPKIPACVCFNRPAVGAILKRTFEEAEGASVPLSY